MSDKIYVGQGVKRGEYDIVNISICLNDIPKEHRQVAKNGKTYANLVVAGKREKDQYGKTHYVAIDTWKPDPDYKKTEQATPAKAAPKDDDLPF